MLNYFKLNYNKADNKFEAIELDDLSYLEHDQWAIKVHTKEGWSIYIVDADSEYNAIDYVSTYLNGNYFIADVVHKMGRYQGRDIVYS